MKSKIILSLLTMVGLLSIKSSGQWLLIDTMLSSNQCSGLNSYSVSPVFVNYDTAFYFYNMPKCSPSTDGGYSLNRTTDAFVNWQNIFYLNQISGGEIHDVSFVNGNVGFMSSWSGGVDFLSKTINAGTSWNTVAFSIMNPLVSDLFFMEEDSGFAISYDGVLYRYYNDTIHLIDTINFTPCYQPKMFFTSNNFGYILAENVLNSSYHKVLRSTDAGVNWSISLNNPSRYFYDINFFNDSIGYLTSDTGLFFTIDAGLNWTLMNTPFANCSSISIVSNFEIYAIGSGGVYKTIDGGINWTQQLLPIICNPGVIKMINDSLGFIYARQTFYPNENIVLKTTNGGEMGVKETIDFSSVLSVQPNPCSNLCEVVIPKEFKNEASLTLTLYNVEGKLIQQISFSSLEFKIVLNIEGIAKGLYTIVLNNSEEVFLCRFIHE